MIEGTGTLIMSKWKTVAEICAREQRRDRRRKQQPG
jgi:hypothetical protein